jgi:hypothetical protein
MELDHSKDDNEKIQEDDDFESIDDSEIKMTETIAKAHTHMLPILTIFNDAFIQDNRHANIRQLDYSVNEFISRQPNTSFEHFDSTAFDLENKLKDARCFFMFLQQLLHLHPRNVRTLLLYMHEYPSTLFSFCLTLFMHYVTAFYRTLFGNYQRPHLYKIQ